MLSVEIAKERALRRAVETGEMPNWELIHDIQKYEGFRPCFGLAEAECARPHCRWYRECMALLRTALRHETPTG